MRALMSASTLGLASRGGTVEAPIGTSRELFAEARLLHILKPTMPT